MTKTNDVQQMIGRTAVDTDGTKIGKIGQVYLDDQTGEPVWVTVKTGMLGSKQNFAPLYGSKPAGDDIQLGVSKDLIQAAPTVDDDGHLEDNENDALYQHYAGHLGDRPAPQHRDDGRRDLAGEPGVQGRDTSGPTTDNAMTRSEEQLHVGTENVETGTARLRKYIVTENVTTTVPVSREEVRLEREPITDANRGAAMSGGDITEEEHEITLHSERPVVSKQTVPVERVKLGTETVTGQQEVSETLRKERIDEADLTEKAESTTR
jgi:uncharacterized protein (TIGR02271 family)